MQYFQRLLGLALVLLATAGGAALLINRHAAAQHTTVAWQEDLTVVSDRAVNVVNTAEGLTLGTEETPALAIDGNRRYGMLTAPAHTLDWSVTSMKASLQASLPPNSRVQIDVRGHAADGVWSEWQAAADSEPVLLPWPATTVQVRVLLLDDGQANAPVIHRLNLVAEGVESSPATPPPARRAAPLTYKVYASRIGLVGNRTANGHIIRKYDRFVALPSYRSLCSTATNPCEYMVELYYPKTGKRVRAPVWDVGPWNTRDDYWNPSSVRQNWKDLPQGRPQAYAAYYYGYNGGKDQWGRTVASPAGIDLADGTYWNDLGMSGNDWIQVSYLWTAGAPPWETTVDNTTTGRFVASGNWGAQSWPDLNYDTGYHLSVPQAISDPAWFKLSIPKTGNYEVFVWYPAHPDYNAATPYLVKTSNGTQVVRVDQRANGGKWNSIGVFNLSAGDYEAVGVSRWASSPGYVVADAVRIVQR